jgi:hypothetical protein
MEPPYLFAHPATNLTSRLEQVKRDASLLGPELAVSDASSKPSVGQATPAE